MVTESLLKNSFLSNYSVISDIQRLKATAHLTVDAVKNINSEFQTLNQNNFRPKEKLSTTVRLCDKINGDLNYQKFINSYTQIVKVD